MKDMSLKETEEISPPVSVSHIMHVEYNKKTGMLYGLSNEILMELKEETNDANKTNPYVKIDTNTSTSKEAEDITDPEVLLDDADSEKSDKKKENTQASSAEREKTEKGCFQVEDTNVKTTIASVVNSYSSTKCEDEVLEAIRHMCIQDNVRNHYAIYNKVSWATYGKIFMATSIKTKKKTLIKYINLKNYDKEALSAIKVHVFASHPNLLGYKEVYIYEEKLWCVVEELVGVNLIHLQKYCLLDEDQISYILKQLLESLHFLHSHFVAHGGVKSENVFLVNEGEIKLCDFDVTSSFLAKSEQNYKSDTRKFSTSQDIWDLGIIACDLCLSEFLFSRMKREKRFDINVRSAINDLSPDLADFIRGCLNSTSQLRLKTSMCLYHPLITKRERAVKEEGVSREEVIDFESFV